NVPPKRPRCWHTARGPAPGRVDGQRRHGHASSQWRGHHVVHRHRPHASPVLRRHLRHHVHQDHCGVRRHRRLPLHWSRMTTTHKDTKAHKEEKGKKTPSLKAANRPPNTGSIKFNKKPIARSRSKWYA